MNVSKMIYNILEKKGVSDVFMYSGGAIMPLIDQFYKGKINYYVNSHEQNCGHAATGYAKSSGKTGISIVTSGPGLTNSITPLLDATNDSTPFILLSGNVALNHVGTNAFQEAPSVEITKPVTKWSYQVKNPNEIKNVMDEAFTIANTGKKGSVHIDLPKCILTSETNKKYEFSESYSNEIIKYSKSISKIADIILNANRPILYIGQGAKNASEDIRNIAQYFQIPVTSTLHGMGIFDETHELSLKMCGMHGNAAANYALQEADCIIAIGSRFDDRTTGNVSKYAPKCTNFIHLNINESEINKVVKGDYIMGDCKKTVKLLYDNLKNNYLNNSSKYNSKYHEKIAWLSKIDKWKKKNPYRYTKLSNNIIKTQDVLIELNRYIKSGGDDFIITSGVGNHQMMATQYIDWKFPNRFHSSGSLGVMGTGLPYAIGAQIANPDKIVIDVDGDSSFNMTLTDLKTVVEHNLPIKILILNNGTQDMVRIWEKLFFDDRITATTNEINPNYVKLAKSYGLIGIKCNSRKELQINMERFMNYNGPILMECNVKPDICLPLVAPGAGLDEMLLYDEDYNIIGGINEKNDCPC